MKQTFPLRSVLSEAFSLTWRHKMWWFLGLCALFLSGTLGYQLVTQGLSNLARPVEWVDRWHILSSGVSFSSLVRGQWALLMHDPAGWFTLVGVWLVIFLVLFLFLFVSAYAATTILCAIKVREAQGEFRFIPAVIEAWYHIRTVLAVVILTQLAANIVLALFSGPVLALTLYSGGFLIGLVLVALFVLYGFVVVLIAMLAIYSLISAVFYDLGLWQAIKFAWIFFWRHWMVSLLNLCSQIILTIAAAFAVVVAVSFVIIPVTILGYILVSNQQYDITQFLPNLILVLVIVGFFVFGSAYTMFQLCSWALLFLNEQDDSMSLRVSIDEITL